MNIAGRIFGAVVAVAVLSFVLLVAPIPLLPERVLSKEVSPDGRLFAVYSWRPAGLIGLISGDNPWVYVTIYDAKTGSVISHHKVWGDVPDDAYTRLGKDVPWHSSKT